MTGSWIIEVANHAISMILARFIPSIGQIKCICANKLTEKMLKLTFYVVAIKKNYS